MDVGARLHDTRENLRNGSGGGALNGAFFLVAGTTVLDDGVADTKMIGGNGMDWWFIHDDLDKKKKDTATDIALGEIVDMI